MNGFESILNIVDKLGKFIGKEYKGFLGGIILCVFLFIFFCYPDLQDYNNLGKKLGDYKIVKGGEKDIAIGELKIKFNNVIYHRSENDSILVYPSFYFWSPTMNRYEDSKHRFDIGQKISVASDKFYYNIKLEKIEMEGRDTIAFFVVFRSDLPEIGDISKP